MLPSWVPYFGNANDPDETEVHELLGAAASDSARVPDSGGPPRAPRPTSAAERWKRQKQAEQWDPAAPSRSRTGRTSDGYASVPGSARADGLGAADRDPSPAGISGVITTPSTTSAAAGTAAAGAGAAARAAALGGGFDEGGYRGALGSGRGGHRDPGSSLFDSPRGTGGRHGGSSLGGGGSGGGGIVASRAQRADYARQAEEEVLADMGDVLARLKGTSVNIGGKLKTQQVLLDETNADADSIKASFDAAEVKFERLLRSSSCSKLKIIFCLIFVAVFLFALIVVT